MAGGLLLLAAGCGYRPLHAAKGDVRSISVSIFENRTHLPAVEGVLADALTDELAYRGRRVVREGELLLKGKVLSYAVKPASYSAADLAVEYRAQLRVEAVVVETASGKQVWKRELVAERVFPAHDVPVLQRRGEEEAVRVMCREIAGTLFVGLTEDF
ncbi:MAG TPA: LptE family protein [Verrucomicrobiae bacterium]|nr:LptE family protein [Verrucomicrobiae bacterium]